MQRGRVIGKEREVALFGMFGKKSDGPGDGKAAAPVSSPASGGLEFSAAKAEAWFKQARTMHEAGNIEYSMICWLNGLRFDPANMEAMEGFFASASQFRGDSGGKTAPKDMQAAVAGKTPVDRYLANLLNWACKPMDAELGLKAALASAELGFSEPAKWLGPKALDLLTREAKQRKDPYVKLMDAMAKFQIYDVALRAGELANRIDPLDNKLATAVKNMAANATMSRGGYENTGKEGGFRSNLRDAAKQQQIEDQGRMVRTDDATARLIEAAKAEYLASPTDKPTIRKYVEVLMSRAGAEDEAQAIAVLTKAHADTQEYRWRQMAGDIKIKQGRRTLKAMREAAAAGDQTASDNYPVQYKKQLALEIAEFKERVESYPTDLAVKYDLAVRFIENGQHNEAIEQLQLAKSDSKNRLRVLLAMGRAFVAIGWLEEAIDTFRQALEGLSDLEPTTIELRYELMCALQGRAEKDRDVAAAEEAGLIASKIAQQQFGYKDIRQRREAIKALTAQLKG